METMRGNEDFVEWAMNTVEKHRDYLKSMRGMDNTCAALDVVLTVARFGLETSEGLEDWEEAYRGGFQDGKQ